MKKPCAGDPLEKMEITEYNSGKNANRYGCVRKDPTRTCNNILGDRFHAGIDLKADIGTNIYSVSNGSVYASSVSSTFGNYVIIRSGNLFYLYAHLKSKPNISGTISKGQLIGLSGDSGTAKGEPHLHLEVRKKTGNESYNDMTALNIELYLNATFDNQGSANNNC